MSSGPEDGGGELIGPLGRLQSVEEPDVPRRPTESLETAETVAGSRTPTCVITSRALKTAAGWSCGRASRSRPIARSSSPSSAACPPRRARAAEAGGEVVDEGRVAGVRVDATLLDAAVVGVAEVDGPERVA